MADTSIVVKLIDETRAGFQSINSNLSSLDNNATALKSSFDGLKTAASAFVGVLASKAALDFVDTIQTMDNRLKLVTKSQSELNTTFEGLFDVAQKTRAPLTETVDLYSKLSQNQEVSRQSSEDLRKVTEAFTTSLAISGTSGQAAAGAITQFAQAMASGKLQGDEFRSMAEANPRLSQLISDATGIARENLKELASKGFLTAEIAAVALKQALPELQSEMANTDTTVRQAITGMVNEFQRLGREFLDSSGTSTALVEAIQYITANMDNLIPIIKLLGVALAAVFVYFAPWTAAIGAVSAAVVYFADKLGPVAQTILDAFGAALQAVVPKLAGVGAALVALVNLENPFTAYTEASNKSAESFKNTEGKTKELKDETVKFGDESKKATGITDEMKAAIDRSGLPHELAKTKLGDYLKTLDEGIKLAGLDKDAKEVQIAINKALQAAEEDHAKNKTKLSAEEKARIEATVTDKISETQRIRAQLEEQTKDRENAYKKAVELLDSFAKEAKKQNDEQLTATEKFTQDSLAIEAAYNDALLKGHKLTAAERQAIEENYHAAVKGIQTQALSDLTKEYGRYAEESKTNTQQFVDAKAKIEEAYRIAMQGAETATADEIQKINASRDRALLGAQTKFGEDFKKAADEQRKAEMTSTEEYADAIQKLNEAQNAGLIKSQEEYDLVRRKIEKEYRDDVTKEYSNLYGLLTEKIQQFTGMNSKEFGLLKDTVKLVFGVDIDTIIKQAFAEFIKYVIGFRQAGESEIGMFTGIFQKVFGKTGTGSKEVGDFADEAIDALGGMKDDSGGIFSAIGGFISDAFGGGLSVVAKFASGALDLLKGLGKGAGGIFETIGGWIGDVFGGGGGGGNILSSIGDFIGGSDILGSIGEFLGGSELLSTAGSLLSGAGSLALGVGGIMAFGSLVDNVASGLDRWLFGPSDAEVNQQMTAQAAQRTSTQATNAQKVQDLTSRYGVTSFGGNKFRVTDYQTGATQDRTLTDVGAATALGASLTGLQGQGLAAYFYSGSTKYGAKGLAFDEGNVTKYALGGIIDGPTMFATNQGVAIGGEAGTEAILPLSRGPNGELGVQGGGPININFTINAVDARGIDQLLVERRQFITNMVRSATAERGRKVF